MTKEIRQLHHTLIDLVGIERKGPIGIVELTDFAGRNYTTVST
jgi:hypothetical protein